MHPFVRLLFTSIAAASLLAAPVAAQSVDYDVRFQSAETANYWTPADLSFLEDLEPWEFFSHLEQDDLQLVDEFWSPGDDSGLEFGIRTGFHGWAGAHLVLGARDVKVGKLDVSYPARVSFDLPEARTYLPGSTLRIATTWERLGGFENRLETDNPAITFVMEARMGAEALMDARACFFGCYEPDVPSLRAPFTVSEAFELTFDPEDPDAEVPRRDGWNDMSAYASVLCFNYGICGRGRIPRFDTQNTPPAGADPDGDGWDDAGFPLGFDFGLDASGSTLSRGTRSRFLDITTDLDLIFGQLVSLGTWPYGFGIALPENEAGIQASVDILDLNLAIQADVESQFEFTATGVEVSLDFGAPVHWRLVGAGREGRSASVTFDAGDTLEITVPDSDRSVQPDFEVPNRFAPDMTTTIDLSGNANSLRARARVPSASLGRVCIPGGEIPPWGPSWDESCIDVRTPEIDEDTGWADQRTLAFPAIRESFLLDRNQSPWQVPGATEPLAAAWAPFGILPNRAPTAVLAGPATTTEGGPTTFDARSSSDPDGHALSYRWDFGDGSPVVDDAVPVHAWVEDGRYVVSLTVDDGYGLSDTVEWAVDVSNVRPSIVADASSTDEGARVRAFLLQDPGALDVLDVEVDWGDGTIETLSILSGEQLTHVYADDGSRSVSVRVNDDDDPFVVSDTLAVSVANVPPVLSLVDFSTPIERPLRPGDRIEVTLDPQVHFLDAGTLDTHEAWLEWGDGGPVAPLDVTEAPHGPPGSTQPAPGRASARLDRSVDEARTLALRLCVEDDDGGITCEDGPSLDYPSVDLSLATAVMPATPAPGESATHELEVTNESAGDAARRVTVTTALPSRTSILSVDVLRDEPAGLADLVDLRLGRPGGEAGDAMGSAVALAGSLAAVGAPGAEDGAGVVLVFERTANGWRDVATLAGAGGVDAFGAAVLLEGDTLLVGAPGAEGGLGRVHVFERVGDEWLPSGSPLEAPPGVVGFGSALARELDRLAVGAAGSEGVAGAVAIFDRPDGESPWAPWVGGIVQSRDRAAGDEFGAALALSGTRLAVGAPGRAGDLGRAAVFELGPASAQQVAMLYPPAAGPDVRFGAAIGWEGESVLVGAPGHDPDTGVGAVGGVLSFRPRQDCPIPPEAWWLGESEVRQYRHADAFGCPGGTKDPCAYPSSPIATRDEPAVPAKAAKAVDIDGDGDPELSILRRTPGYGTLAHRLEVLATENGRVLPSGFAGFFEEPIVASRHIADFAWGDLDGDGRPELAVAFGDGTFEVHVEGGSPFGYPHFFGAGTTVFLHDPALGARTSGQVAWGDIDGDGDHDLAMLAIADGYRNEVRIALNEGGTLLEPTADWISLVGEGSSSAHPSALDFGPRGADGVQTLAVLIAEDWTIDFPALFENHVRFYRGEAGSGLSWTRHDANPSRGINGTMLSFGDWSGDGLPDVALSYEPDTTLRALQGIEATGSEDDLSLGNAVPLKDPSATDRGNYRMAWADVDGDGDLDLLSGSTRTERGTYHHRLEVTRMEGGFARTTCAPLAIPDFHRYGAATEVVWGEHSLWTYREAESRFGTSVDSRFGASFAVVGELLAVGAPGANTGQGNLQLFRRAADGSWDEAGALVANDGAAGDALGTTVAFDGLNLVAGAPGAAATEGEARAFQRCGVIGPGLLTCAVGTLASGDAATVSVQVLSHCSRAEGAPYESEAWALGLVIDPDAANHEPVDTRSSGAPSADCGGDETPPELVAHLTGRAGANGWFRSDVTVEWEVLDPESLTEPVTSGCETVTIDEDTDAGGTTLTCEATSDGGTAVRSVVIRRDTTPPEIEDTRSGTPGDDGWYRSSVEVAFNCIDELSGVLECPEAVLLDDEGENPAILVRATDRAGNESSLHVVSGVRIDTVPPTIASARTPANEAGWNRGPVTVTCGCTDETSGLRSDGTGCAPTQTVLADDGVDQSATCTARDVAGNLASLTVGGVNVDSTPPSITHVASGTPGSAGWYRSPVTLTFDCEESLSGLAGACPEPVELSASGSDQGATVRARDVAGNVATHVVDDIDIDRTAPTITATITPDPYAPPRGLRAAPTTLSFTCSDDETGAGLGSGMDECPADVVLGPGENQSVTVEARDAAGNVASRSFGDLHVGRATVRAAADIVVEEGDPVEGVLAEVDQPWATTGHGIVDWGDALLVTEVDETTGEALATEPLRESAQLEGAGELGFLRAPAHAYGDDGDYASELCVRVPSGDAYDWSCDTRTISVTNAAPVLEPIEARIAYLDCPLELRVRFFDKGSGDTHEATVDWGDGAGPEPAQIATTELGGMGVIGGIGVEIASAHVYETSGDRVGEVCVTDDDGAETCATFDVSVPATPPPLTVTLERSETTCYGDTAQVELRARVDGVGCENVAYSWASEDPSVVITSLAGAPLASATGESAVLVSDLGVGSHQVRVVAIPPVDSLLERAVASVTIDIDEPCDPLSLGCCDADLDGVLDASSLQLVARDVVMTCVRGGAAVYPNTVLCDDDGDGVFDGRCVQTLCDTDGDGEADGDCLDSESACQADLRWSFDPPAPLLFGGCGEQEVTVTVRDRCGRSSSALMTVSVGDEEPPTLEVGPDVVLEQQGCSRGTPYDVAENVVRNEDACSEEPALDTGGAPALFPLGETEVTLTSTDECGNESAPASFRVVVVNTPPELAELSDLTVDEGSPLLVEVAATDPRTDWLRVTWNWGDGSAPEVRTVDNPSLAAAEILEGASHVYGDDGTFPVTVTVEDDCGGVAERSFSVTVRNVAPSITGVALPTADEGTPVAPTGLVSDPGSDDVTLTWVWGDGTASSDVRYRDGAGPDADPSPDVAPVAISDFETHAWGDDGLYTVTLTVTDDDGGSVTASFDVSVENLPPVIEPFGPVTADEGQLDMILARASDPGTDDLTFRWSLELKDDEESVHYHDGVGPDGDPSPEGEWPTTVEASPSDVFGDDGTFAVVLTVEDDDGGVATYETTATIANVPPSLPATLPVFSLLEGESLELDVSVTDPGSDDLRVTWSWGHASLPDALVELPLDPSAPDGRPSPELDPRDESASASRVYGDDGAFTLTVTAEDDDGGIATRTTSVSVGNLSPVIDPDSVRAGLPVDLRLRVVGPEGWTSNGPPASRERTEGFRATLLVFEGEVLVASESVAEAADGEVEVLIEGMDLDLGLRHSVRVAYESWIDADAVAWIEMELSDGSVRTLEHRFDAPVGHPGQGLPPRILDEPHRASWRASVNDLALGALGALGDGGLALRASILGVDGPHRRGRFDLSLLEDGIVLRSASLDAWQARHDDDPAFVDDPEGVPPAHFLLELDEAAADELAAYEILFTYGDRDRDLDSTDVRVELGESGEWLFHPFIERRAEDPCRGADPCIEDAWSESIQSLVFGAPVHFTAEAEDVGSDDLTFEWTWGDGSAIGSVLHLFDGTAPDELPSPSEGPHVVLDEQVHRFRLPGTLEYGLDVLDDDGGTDRIVGRFVVLEGAVPPEVEPSSVEWDTLLDDPKDRPSSRHEREFVRVRATATDTDSDELWLTWDWDDGSETLQLVSYEGDPLEGGAFIASLEARHDYEDAGTYRVTLTVTDEAGGSSSVSVDVTTEGNGR